MVCTFYVQNLHGIATLAFRTIYLPVGCVCIRNNLCGVHAKGRPVIGAREHGVHVAKVAHVIATSAQVTTEPNDQAGMYFLK
jgi:hypothetical protein